MTSERTLAYGLVVRTLDDLGPAKLQPAEQDRIREAADTLIFAAEPDGPAPPSRTSRRWSGTSWTATAGRPSAHSSSCTTSRPAGRSRPSPDGRDHPRYLILNRAALVASTFPAASTERYSRWWVPLRVTRIGPL